MTDAATPSSLAGRLIAFEGGDGSGKSTQVDLLVGRLRDRRLVDAPGRPQLVVTREPGATPLGAAIRQALLHGGGVSPLAEALLYAADRAQHVAQLLRPALDRGALVVTDRFLDSSIAYQVEGRGLEESLVRAINAPGVDGLVPDLTILLDIDPAQAARRRADRSRGAEDRLEQAGADFHARVNRRYLELAATDSGRYAIIAAGGEPQAVASAVWEALAQRARAWRRDAAARGPEDRGGGADGAGARGLEDHGGGADGAGSDATGGGT